VSGDDDLRFYGLYNLVQVKATGRVGLYIGGVLAPAANGGDWMEVRFDDGTHWRFRPHELKPPKGASRIFNTEKYAFNKSAPASWRRVWQEWSAENAAGQLMSTLRMAAERQIEPQCWADEEGLLGVLIDVWFEEGIYGRTGRYSREGLRLAWHLAFHEELAPDAEIEAYLEEIRPAMEAARQSYFREQDARRASQERERLATVVASGSYEGVPLQAALPGIE
jgi:hypothetical protein